MDQSPNIIRIQRFPNRLAQKSKILQEFREKVSDQSCDLFVETTHVNADTNEAKLNFKEFVRVPKRSQPKTTRQRGTCRLCNQ